MKSRDSRHRPFKNNTLFILIIIIITILESRLWLYFVANLAQSQNKVFLDETKKNRIFCKHFFGTIYLLRSNKTKVALIIFLHSICTVQSGVILSQPAMWFYLWYTVVYCCPLESHVPLYYCTYRQLYQMGTFTVHIGHTPDCPIPLLSTHT